MRAQFQDCFGESTRRSGTWQCIRGVTGLSIEKQWSGEQAASLTALMYNTLPYHSCVPSSLPRKAIMRDDQGSGLPVTYNLNA